MKKYLVVSLVVLSLLVFSKTIHIKAGFVRPSEEKIEYVGNVILEVEEESFVLTSENLVIRKLEGKWRLTEASSSVVVILEDGKLTGEHLVYDIETRQGTITGNVEGEFLDKASTETIYITCDSITFDLEDNVFLGKGNVQIEKGSIMASSEGFVYKREKGIIELSIDVNLEDSEKDLKMKADRVTIDLENDTMEASSVDVTLEVE
ncbi:hypothetical protein [Thermotoga sp. KOL6]|uniref:hypothetical protein n=1 Tax=Thermotoga sp. KOL6 TaxID=126741 RepID=UPI000C770466|nr:hypothetical protein [Thermotoga sp. KOL6]PLV59413.1 hypothetical protein AS005_06655 [Thermotoga sp. KOL6]